MFSMNYFYGPVSSRRLGFSLGVDLFFDKICSFDCLYCQLGSSRKRTVRRISCVNFSKFKQELELIFKAKPVIDFITISGSGEPTLHKNLDKIIKTIKKVTRNSYPVCLITNSSLLYRKDVRKELSQADLVIPSLDAATAKTFAKLNRPAKGLNFTKTLEGLIKFSREFKGQIWLEVMLVSGVNDTVSEIKKFKQIIQKINPDKVQLNLPVRPSATEVKLPSSKKLEQIRKAIGFKNELVSDFYDGRKELTATRTKLR